jgi:hypothetical protein
MMIFMRLWMVAAFAVPMFAPAPVRAQEQGGPTPAGHWEGAILVPAGELGINVDLMPADGVWEGDISIPAQATEDFALSEVSVNGMEVSFLMAGVPGEPTFRGTLSEDGSSITGTFSQGGQNLEFKLTRVSPGKP